MRKHIYGVIPHLVAVAVSLASQRKCTLSRARSSHRIINSVIVADMTYAASCVTSTVRRIGCTWFGHVELLTVTILVALNGVEILDLPC